MIVMKNYVINPLRNWVDLKRMEIIIIKQVTKELNYNYVNLTTD